MINVLRTVLRPVDIPIFSKVLLRFNWHARRDRNKTVDRICPRVNAQKEKLFIGGVDISESQIIVAIVDENGRMLTRADCATDVYPSYSEGLHAILEVLQHMAHQRCIKISGIGISCIGEVNPIIGAFGDISFLPGWNGNRLVEDLARESGVPVALENGADAAALAEALWGEDRDKARLIFVRVGDGIHGGVVTDGKLYRRAEMPHPEIGHHVVSRARRICSCGRQGCWESRAAGGAMVGWFKKHAPASPEYRNITAKEICELAQQGNDLACRAIRRAAHYLGLGLADLIDVFEPDAIILGGNLMKSASLFIDVIRKVISAQCPFTNTKLALPSLGEDATLIAAAAVWHHRFRPAVFARYPGVLTVDLGRAGGTAYSKQGPDMTW